MNIIHKDLFEGRWFQLSFYEQMAHIGSEVARAISWRNKREEYSQRAFERSLELFDLTVMDSRNKKRLKELLRCRELWVDYIFGSNTYNQDERMWQKYFDAFANAASLRRYSNNRR